MLPSDRVHRYMHQHICLGVDTDLSLLQQRLEILTQMDSQGCGTAHLGSSSVNRVIHSIDIWACVSGSNTLYMVKVWLWITPLMRLYSRGVISQGTKGLSVSVCLSYVEILPDTYRSSFSVLRACLLWYSPFPLGCRVPPAQPLLQFNQRRV